MTNNFSASLHCLANVKELMSQNFLQLNYGKTEVLFIGPNNVSSHAQACLGNLKAITKITSRN